MKLKMFRIRDKYRDAAKLIIDDVENLVVQYSKEYDLLVKYNVLDIFGEETYKLKVSSLVTDKQLLLYSMQCWADLYNNIDNFVPEWSNLNQIKWGISISHGTPIVGPNYHLNAGLFQLSVSSRERAIDMLKIFNDRIQLLLKQNLI